MKKTKFQCIWFAILGRCGNPRHSNYAKYGGRGIRVEWASFEAFEADMHESYLDHKTKHPGERQTQIERINNNGNYSKRNCRWATAREQSLNRRRADRDYSLRDSGGKFVHSR